MDKLMVKASIQYNELKDHPVRKHEKQTKFFNLSRARRYCLAPYRP